jgi:hypothetical protein
LSFQFNLTTQHEQEIGASYQTNLAILIATGFGTGIDFYLMPNSCTEIHSSPCRRMNGMANNAK